MAPVRPAGSVAASAIVAVLATAAVYEAAVAIGLIDLGRLPGDGPRGEGFVLALAVSTLIAGAVLALVLAAQKAPATTTARLFAPAGVAFVVARFYTFDPYYLPALRRMSDGGLVSAEWVWALAVAAAAVAIVMPRAGRPALVATSVLLLVAAGTAVLASAGH